MAWNEYTIFAMLRVVDEGNRTDYWRNWEIAGAVLSDVQREGESGAEDGDESSGEQWTAERDAAI